MITTFRHRLIGAAALSAVAILLAGCATATTPEATAEAESTPTATASAATFAASAGDCDAIAASFRDVTSANADLPDPELTATCTDDTVTMVGNNIPDYLYVGTTPGVPNAGDVTIKIAGTPTEADTPSAVSAIGMIAVAINGLPIFGATEGTGGDVFSLQGALSECGSHNGPGGFHMHLITGADGVDCLYSSDEFNSGESLLVGWSPDGYPIMSGLVCDDAACSSTTQLTSSWQLTDESLFATDTWSAHSYVAGSGDLDQCNGRVDSDGQYRYYTTATFPYTLGCYHGVVAADAIGAPNAGGGGGGPAQP